MACRVKQCPMELGALDRTASGRGASSRSSFSTSGRRHVPCRPQVSCSCSLLASHHNVWSDTDSPWGAQAAATLEAPPDSTTGKHEPLPKCVLTAEQLTKCYFPHCSPVLTLLHLGTASTYTSQHGGLLVPYR